MAADTVENLSQKLEGAKTLESEIKGPAGDVKEALEKTFGGLFGRVLGKESRGATKFEVVTDGANDTREALFYCVVKNKWVLYQLSPVGMSLEDVFLKLTTKESAA